MWCPNDKKNPTLLCAVLWHAKPRPSLPKKGMHEGRLGDCSYPCLGSLMYTVTLQG